ncbi:MAG: hypothetical protein WDN09_01455 [bacterium]
MDESEMMAGAMMLSVMRSLEMSDTRIAIYPLGFVEIRLRGIRIFFKKFSGQFRRMIILNVHFHAMYVYWLHMI